VETRSIKEVADMKLIGKIVFKNYGRFRDGFAHQAAFQRDKTD
jgi:hypothetical protein